MKIFDLLYQDKVWITGGGSVVTLKEMAPSHRRNLIAFLERRASQLKFAYEFYVVSGPHPSGEMASDAFDREVEQLMSMDAIDWLNETPLMIELRRREAKYNSPKQVRKRQRQRDADQAELFRRRQEEREQNGWDR